MSKKQYLCTGCGSMYLKEEDVDKCEIFCDREEV